MASSPPTSRSTTPSGPPPNFPPTSSAPAVPSPLNPNPAARPAKPPAREQREKKETLKKRESNANARGGTPDVKSKNVKTGKGKTGVPSPMRYSILPPKADDYRAYKEGLWANHEPAPLYAPGHEGEPDRELKRPMDHAENKKMYRYTPTVADPLFPHKQYYRGTDAAPWDARMSIEDSDRVFHFDSSCNTLVNDKGWRMARSNVCAREGRMYYEVKILKGVPKEGGISIDGSVVGEGPQPHIRMGWARREAPLDAPIGFDGYSYGLTDLRFETMHRSRAGKLYTPVSGKAAKAKATKKGAVPSASSANATRVEAPPDHVRTGDVIGLEIQLPSLSLHRKVVVGDYNPAVDLGDGFPDPSAPREEDPDAKRLDLEPALDVIRDRIPVPYRGNTYFESFEYASTPNVQHYGDRSATLASSSPYYPHPNHKEPELRTLPHSAIRVYKNGKLVGTAFEGLLAFLPPASRVGGGEMKEVSKDREVFDDGGTGYYPAVSSFFGGIAEINFGPTFAFPPEGITSTADAAEDEARLKLVEDRSRLRPVGERWKEQVAEDIIWDIIDECDFFGQDGGFEGELEKQARAGWAGYGLDGVDERT